MNTNSRYPGAQPFEKNQDKIFFGRDVEINNLRRKINLVPLTVLYGKSGYGKSSLLNAGLLPLLEKEGEYKSVRIRFNPWQHEKDDTTPLVSTQMAMSSLNNTQHLSPIIENDDSLWRQNKEYFIENEGKKGLLLVFDQFEELFTYPEEAILEFRQQLAEVLYTTSPQRYWDRLEDAYDQKEEHLDKDILNLFQEQANIKVVIAIRSDRLHLLQKMSDYIPLILKNLQELSPLNEKQAKLAITEPAIIKGDFNSPRFTYNPDALNKITQFLTDDGAEEVETTQLQIICHHLEQKIAASGAYEITLEDVGQLEAIIENYYEGRISLIEDTKQRYAARRLVEEGLIFEEEERRLSIYEGQALRSFGMKPETLQLLVNSHLLRAEPSLRGGYTYELSHDTLVAPILKAKKIRIDKEQEKARLKIIRQQEFRSLQERKKRRRAYLIAFIGVALALIATIAAVLAYKQAQTIEKARKAMAQNAYDFRLILAANYKIQGKYDVAIKLLSEASQKEEDLPLEVKELISSWSQMMNLTHKADSLWGVNEWGIAIKHTIQADNISSDPYLQQLIQNRQTERDKKLDILLRSAERQTNIGQHKQALKDYQNALKLSPNDSTIIKKIEEIKRLY